MDGALCHVFSVVAKLFLVNGGVHCLAVVIQWLNISNTLFVIGIFSCQYNINMNAKPQYFQRVH